MNENGNSNYRHKNIIYNIKNIWEITIKIRKLDDGKY